MTRKLTPNRWNWSQKDEQWVYIELLQNGHERYFYQTEPPHQFIDLVMKIKDLNDYQQELERIVSSIYGHSNKPPLGEPPRYTNLTIDNIPGLNQVDTLVFKIICETSLSTNSDKLTGS